ncbi:hypothetical protein HDU96_005220 [Phlyctochytrium bullatum]|nr:hypothetical protein HDU96_005220 [Phlyctochytrium bullatum]
MSPGLPNTDGGSSSSSTTVASIGTSRSLSSGGSLSSKKPSLDPLASPAVRAAWNAGGATAEEDLKRTPLLGTDLLIPPVTVGNSGAARPRSTSISNPPPKHSYATGLFTPPGSEWMPQQQQQGQQQMMEAADVLGLGLSSLTLGVGDDAWARLHRSKSVDFRSPKPLTLSHAISMEEILLGDRANLLPNLARTSSQWASPHLTPGPGPVAKPIRSPYASPHPSPRHAPEVVPPPGLTEHLALPPSVLEAATTGSIRPAPVTKPPAVDGSASDDTDTNSPTAIVNEVPSPTLSTISIPLSALSQTTLAANGGHHHAPPAPVVIPYPTAEQIAHPDRNFSELDGLISDIVKRMLYRDEPAPLGASCQHDRKSARATTPAVTPVPGKPSKSKSSRNASLSSSASTVVNPGTPSQTPPPLPAGATAATSATPKSLPPADHAHITLNVAGAVPYHPPPPPNPYKAAQPQTTPPPPTQRTQRVVADRVETVNRLGQVKSRIEFRRVVEVPLSAVPDAAKTGFAPPSAPGVEPTTFITGPVMGKDDEPSLAEEIASVLEAVAEDTGSATLSVTVRSFVDPAAGHQGPGGEGHFPHSAMKGAAAAAGHASAGWYGGSAPCGGGKACGGDVMHDIWGYNVGPAEICPCGRHLAEGMRIFKLRKEVVAWVCSSTNGVPHQPPQHPAYPHPHHHGYGGFGAATPHGPASATSPLHHGVVGGSMMVGYGAAMVGQAVLGAAFERYV